MEPNTRGRAEPSAWQPELFVLLHRTRWPNTALLAAAIYFTVDLTDEARRWLFGYLVLVLFVAIITYPQAKRRENPPAILGVADILSPMALP
ncbi:MAG: hypothetical protein ACERLM_01095, partial [Acidimicrobiales bacterium]